MVFKTFDYTKIKKIFRQYKAKNKFFKTFNKDRDVEAFDTETEKGNIFLIASSKKYLYSSSYISFKNLIEFLFKNGKKLNFFYNIKYDLNVILKPYFTEKNLTKEEALKILEQKKIEYENYTIVWGNKFFKITKNKKTKYYFDIMQFYNLSLNEASKKYLNDEKIDVDVENLRYEDKEKVIQYCVKDAQLTLKLSLKIIDTVEKIFGKIPRHFYSKAYFSFLYVAEKLSNFKNILLPNTLPNQLLKLLCEYSFKAYHGGIFEAFVKGKVGSCEQYDINSAYPFFIRLIPNFSLGAFVYKHKFSKNEYKKLDNISKIWCVAKVKVKYNGFMPYQSEKLGKVIYPITFNAYQNFLTGIEILNFFDQIEEIEEIIYFKSFKHELPFMNIVNELYQLKEEQRDKDKMLYNFYKIILNGIYGKMMQYKYNISYMFNPLVGALIPAFTRVYIYKLSKHCFSKVFAISTDSVIGLANNKINAIVNKKIGCLKREKVYTNLYIYQIGIYSENGVFIKTRGFEHTSNVQIQEDKLIVEFKKNTTIAEGIIQKCVNKTGVIENVVKTIYFMNDYKRIFIKTKEYDYLLGIEWSDDTIEAWKDEDEMQSKILEYIPYISKK
jgi:hypothetical protein